MAYGNVSEKESGSNHEVVLQSVHQELAGKMLFFFFLPQNHFVKLLIYFGRIPDTESLRETSKTCIACKLIQLPPTSCKLFEMIALGSRK